jgi:hypothetical protein
VRGHPGAFLETATMSIQSTGRARDPGVTGGRIAYSVADAALVSGLSRSALYVALREKRLAAKKLGARTIITHDELARFVASLPPMGQAAA